MLKNQVNRLISPTNPAITVPLPPVHRHARTMRHGRLNQDKIKYFCS